MLCPTSNKTMQPCLVRFKRASKNLPVLNQCNMTLGNLYFSNWVTSRTAPREADVVIAAYAFNAALT